MTIRLPRIPRGQRIADATGVVTVEFQAWWQRAMEQIEAQFGAVDAAIAAQAAADAAQTAADDAIAAAASADASATTAQTSANNANSVASLTNSGVTPNPLTATDAGADATVFIAAHTRLYGDGTSVSVNSGSVSGLAYSTLYYIYYDQASRLGGAVTYLATTSVTTAAQTGDRHLVGNVTTPAAAAPDTDGEYVAPPGVGGIIP